jgi:hypothetical protein
MTIMHIEVKAEFCQIELGIKAGFPEDSRCFIHSTKAGIMAAAMQSNEILIGCLILERFPVMTLYSYH